MSFSLSLFFFRASAKGSRGAQKKIYKSFFGEIDFSKIDLLFFRLRAEKLGAFRAEKYPVSRFFDFRRKI